MAPTLGLIALGVKEHIWGMDSSTAQVVTTISTVTGTIVVAYLAYKTTTLGRKVDEVKKQTDGLTEKLVASTASASHAEGKLEGKEESKAESAGEALLPPRPDA